MKCPRCQHENETGAKFCEECAAPLARRCARCGRQLSPTARFCPECAHATGLSAAPSPQPVGAPEHYTPKYLAEKILTSRSALEGERKQVTVLFCDLANSTALAERIGAEAMHGLLSRFFELALAEVHRFEGTINQFLGDGFMALFGAPLAHEDHARRGVLAALAIDRVLRDRERRMADLAQGTLVVRMGLNTGFVVVGAIGDDLRMDYTAVGDTTNLAARLQQLAEPGRILVSEATARVVRGDVVLEPIGPLEIRGKSVPVHASRVMGPRPRRRPFMSGEGRTLSPFVGRGRELAALRDLQRIAEGGQGQIIEIVGEPGAGKSRLLHEFARSVEDQRVTWLEGRCLSYGAAIMCLPIVDIFRAGCGISGDDAAPTVATKLNARLAEVGMDPADATPYLLHFLGVDEGAERVADLPPDVIRPRTFRILRDMTVKAAQRRPLVLVIEDVHWIDQSSEEYLLALADSLAGAPILLVATTRPGARPPWMDKSYATQLTLRPLSSAESLTLARSVAVEALSEEVAETILRKAEGNPFFLEELTRTALEQVGDVLPDTIHAVLAARIDRLPSETKTVLKTAAVLGREFSTGLLEAVCDGGDLSPHLKELLRRELLYERVGADSPVYVFKHALTQEVAYDSLLSERRRQVHRRVVKEIERLHRTRLTEHIEHLAYHAFRGQMWEEAAQYARQAGLKAAARKANREAVAMFEQALTAVENVPNGLREAGLAIDLRFDLKNALVLLGELRGVFALLDEAERLARAADDTGRVGWSLMHQGHSSYMAGNFARVGELAQTTLRIAGTVHDAALEVGTNYYLAHASFNLGDYPTAVQIFQRTVAAIPNESAGERFGLILTPASSARAYQALSLAYMGRFSEAAAVGAEAIAIGDVTDHPFTLVNALLCSGMSRALGGDIAGAAADLQRGRAVCEEWNIGYVAPLMAGTVGWVQALSGSTQDGLQLLEQGDVGARSVGFMVPVLFLQPLLVEAQVLAGRLERAAHCARSALELIRRHHTRGFEAMLLRLMGQIAADRSVADFDEAEQHYRDALVLASQLSMRPLVAHCHLGLGKLYHRTDKREQAREHLATATTMYREMGMTYWLEKAEAEDGRGPA
jgi:class 3 adenylate cyclase/tetratricopeptide (TPR) repeat protein